MRIYYKLYIIVIVSLLAVPIYIHVKGHGHSDVLYHYIFKDFNINKFRCAVFLLDNMRYHASVYGEEALTDEQQAIKDRTDSIYASLAGIYGWDSIPVDTIIYKVRRKSIEWAEKNIRTQDSQDTEYLAPDNKAVTSDFLIRQIDEAYEIWTNSPFTKGMSLAEFEESLLPYCCIPAYGRLQTPRQLQAMMPSLKGLAKETELRDIVAHYWRAISNLRDINGSMGDKATKGIMSLYSRDEDCLDIAHYGCMLLRAYGVPTVVDHVVGFRQLPERHYFCCLYNTVREEWQGFNAEGSLPGDSDFLGTPTLNIYRDMYAAQRESPYFLRSRDEYVPAYLNNPCIKDVSGLYMETVSVTLPFYGKTNNRLAYLAAFSVSAEDGLLATTWGVVDKKNNMVTFNNALLNVLYFPVFYDGNRAECFGDPFYLHKDNGTVRRHYLPTKGKGNRSALLLRKYPPKKSMTEQARKMIGTVFLGSNDSTFGKADTLLVLKAAPSQYLKEYRFSRTGNYKYYRLQPPRDYPHCTISQLEWLTRKGYTRDAMTSSRTAVTSPSMVGNVTRDAKMVKLRDAKIREMEKQPQYDGNPLTSAGGKKNITLTLRSPQRVEGVRLMAVHENNVINAGDEYQLFYWDGSEWALCGEQTAEYEYLLFNNIPAANLYWLRDVSKGQEELPFLLGANGAQHFLYPDIIKDM